MKFLHMSDGGFRPPMFPVVERSVSKSAGSKFRFKMIPPWEDRSTRIDFVQERLEIVVFDYIDFRFRVMKYHYHPLWKNLNFNI